MICYDHDDHPDHDLIYDTTHDMIYDVICDMINDMIHNVIYDMWYDMIGSLCIGGLNCIFKTKDWRFHSYY